MSSQREWLRRAAEGRATSPVPRLHWCEVCQVAAEFTNAAAPGLDRGRTPHALPRRLDVAIEAVHRSEQAQLLVEASALRVTTTEEAGVGLLPLLLGLGALGRGGPAPSDPAHGAPADGDPADGDPAEGDLADGDPADGDPADGDLADGDPAHRGARPVWLARLGEELELARADEVEVPLELVACSLWPARLWGRGSGEALARAALALEPSPEVHLALVRALVARGRPGAALVELERLAARRASDPVPERAGFGRAVDLARAAAFERRGDLSATLVGLDRVGEAGWPLADLFPDEDPGDEDETTEPSTSEDATLGVETEPHAGDRLLLDSLTLALALILGDPGVAERAQLRMFASGFTPGIGWEAPVRSAVLRWRAALRVGRSSEGTSGLPDASAGVVFRMLASHDPALARVAFLVIGA